MQDRNVFPNVISGTARGRVNFLLRRRLSDEDLDDNREDLEDSEDPLENDWVDREDFYDDEVELFWDDLELDEHEEKKRRKIQEANEY